MYFNEIQIRNLGYIFSIFLLLWLYAVVVNLLGIFIPTQIPIMLASIGLGICVFNIAYQWWKNR